MERKDLIGHGQLQEHTLEIYILPLGTYTLNNFFHPLKIIFFLTLYNFSFFYNPPNNFFIIIYTNLLKSPLFTNIYFYHNFTTFIFISQFFPLYKKTALTCEAEIFKEELTASI